MLHYYLKNIAQPLMLCLPALFVSIAPVQAQVVHSTFASRAQGLRGESISTITVWPGAGTNLNFIPSGEIVQKVWLDDPSRITLDFDGQMCSTAVQTAEDDCTSSPVTVVHLKQINPIKFASLPSTPRTLLTVVTQGANGRQLYQFEVHYGTGKPQYHALAIYPDTGKPIAFQSVNTSVDQLTSFEQGLAIAEANQWVTRQSPVWHRIQSFVKLNRSGASVKEAAQQAGISIALVNKLVELSTTSKTRLPFTPSKLLR